MVSVTQRSQLAQSASAQGQTQTQTETRIQPTLVPPASAPAILRLRGAQTATSRSVQWREDVVDNEGLGRKKSKVCCIYHQPRAVDESSDESSSDTSSSDSDSNSGGEHKGDHKDDANHKEGHKLNCGNDQGMQQRKDRSDGGRRKRKPSPNAYEKIPKLKPRENIVGGKNWKDPPESGK